MSAPNSITLNAGSGGPTAATIKDSTSVNHQLVALEYWTGSGDPVPVEPSSPLPVVDAATVAQNSTTSGQSGTLVQAAVVSGSQSYTAGHTSPVTQDTTGALRVNVVEGSGGGGTQIQDGTAFTRGTSSETPIAGIVASSAPSLTVGDASVATVDSTDAGLWVHVTNGIAAGTASAPSSSLASMTPQASVSGGASESSSTITSGTPAVVTVKSGAGQIYTLEVVNCTTSVVYLHFYDVSGGITLGTTAATATRAIPANSSGAGIIVQFPVGRAFTNQIAFAVTGGSANTDNTSLSGVSATAPITVNVGYK
jgi:hypothetical protein